MSAPAEKKSGLSPSEKKELKLKYGSDTLLLEEQEGAFIFRRPEKHVYAQFMASLSNEKRRNEDRLPFFEQLCIGCLVYPEKAPGEPDYDRLLALFQRLPGAALNIGGELNDLAGAGDSLKLGKL
jgi:hypothetical protein